MGRPLVPDGALPYPASVTTIAITGGTGTLGRAFAPRAEAAGHRVRILSRREAPADLASDREWARADPVSGEGLRPALEGAHAVLHAASDPRSPREVDVEGTDRLLAAATEAGVRHFLYPSIVGIDGVRFGYYEAKVEAERRVAASGVPCSVVRGTQFHSFVHRFVSLAGKLPVVLLPTDFVLQSVWVGDYADALLDRLGRGPGDRAPDVAGPEVLTLGEMVESWKRVTGKRRLVVRLPVPGALARAFREGRIANPGRAVGELGWEEWLRRRPSPEEPVGRFRSESGDLDVGGGAESE